MGVMTGTINMSTPELRKRMQSNETADNNTTRGRVLLYAKLLAQVNAQMKCGNLQSVFPLICHWQRALQID